MPAYRSPAEAEVRDAVVARLRMIRPRARIIHEINCACWGENRIDLIAVDLAEIIAVEIKSEKDKLDRLAQQVSSMQAVAHHVIAAIHEKHLVEVQSSQFAAHSERDGKFWRRDMPDGQPSHGLTYWIYPETRRALTGGIDYLWPWKEPDPAVQHPLPPAAINMLWADELRGVCHSLGVSANSRSTRPQMMRALEWMRSGGDITKAVCAALRARKCVEADPAIEGAAHA